MTLASMSQISPVLPVVQDIKLHTYAAIQTLLYHLGPNALKSVAPTNPEAPVAAGSHGSYRASGGTVEGPLAERCCRVATAAQNKGPRRAGERETGKIEKELGEFPYLAMYVIAYSDLGGLRPRKWKKLGGLRPI
jgi:hypothetical protein